MKVPTVAVQHPSNPERRILVNEADADRYVAWEREPDVEAPAGYAGMDYQALRRLAADRDLDVPGRPKKDELVAALEAADEA